MDGTAEPEWRLATSHLSDAVEGRANDTYYLFGDLDNSEYTDLIDK